MRYAYHESLPDWKGMLLQGLEEDDWRLDWTTKGALRSGVRAARARIVAKSSGIWAANGGLQALGEYGILVESRVSDGAPIGKGMTVCTWRGPAREVLALERPFLNLASYVGGIATRTHGIVKLVSRACPKRTPRITSTRKTLPGYRDLAIYGVISGGGYPHRTGLSGGVLIKENHIAAAGGIASAVEGARRVAPHLLKIEVEVRSDKELREALRAGADVVMLDNFSPSQVRKALKTVSLAKHHPMIEVSGGLNESNIDEYALPGVDILSVGSLTHSIEALDLSLLFES